MHETYFDNYYGNCVTIRMGKRDALKCSHQGDCEEDVREVIKLPYIAKQLKGIDDETLRNVLKPYGAWDESELQNREWNELRLIWLAAGNIVEELAEQE